MYSTREFATTSRAMPFACPAVSSSDTCIVSGRVLEESELEELRAEVEGMLARAPFFSGATVDEHGQPAFGVQPNAAWLGDDKKTAWEWALPLGDPRGGRGKSAAQMRAYTPPADSPERCARSTTLHLFVGLSKLLFGCATQSRDEAQFCMEV